METVPVKVGHVLRVLFIALILWLPVRGCALRETSRGEPASGPAKVGVRYKYDLLTHCGIEFLTLGNDLFRTSRPVGDPVPPWWWGQNFHPGSVELTSRNTAVFTGSNGLTIQFKKIDDSEQHFGCE